MPLCAYQDAGQYALLEMYGLRSRLTTVTAKLYSITSSKYHSPPAFIVDRAPDTANMIRNFRTMRVRFPCLACQDQHSVAHFKESGRLGLLHKVGGKLTAKIKYWRKTVSEQVPWERWKKKRKKREKIDNKDVKLLRAKRVSLIVLDIEASPNSC